MAHESALRKVEQIYAGENDEEGAEEGCCFGGVCHVEALEQNERCCKDGGGKGNVVYRSHTMFRQPESIGPSKMALTVIEEMCSEPC